MYRKATAGDCQAVYELICDMEGKLLPYESFRDIFLRQLEDGRYLCLVLEEEGRVIGELNLRFEDQLHHAGPVAEILEFAIHRDCRGLGLGKDMLARACQIARERGCGQIELACNKLRQDAHRFYRREGLRDFHYKFSRPLNGEDWTENVLGR